jgi:hypothetical protein
MGDRVRVSIHVRKSDIKYLIDKEFDGDSDKFSSKVEANEYNEYDSCPLVELVDQEANYGNWESLEEFLCEKKIEFDKEWGEGGGFGKGSAYFRLVKGKIKQVEVYAHDEGLLKFLTAVKNLPPEEIKKAVKKELKKLSKFEITPLDQPNSVKLIMDLANEGGAAETSKCRSNKNK